MSVKLDEVIDGLFAQALDSTQEIKTDVLNTVITEKKTAAIKKKSKAILEIEADLAEAVKRNADSSVITALKNCLKQLESFGG